jgi:type I restriction enzyme, R subunit
MNPDFREESSSQLPAIRLLCNMGWKVLTADEALALRGGRQSAVLLEGVLTEWLRRSNRISYKGQSIPFSDGNIAAAVQSLKSVVYDGLVRTNEKIYDLICLPKSLKQTVEGDTRSFDLYYIDWKHPERNVYHLVEEFTVDRVGRPDDREKEPEELEISDEPIYGEPERENTRRPDIILFVNGIPLVVIECKRPDKKHALEEAVSQNIRNQGQHEIPTLFQYTQLILALAGNQAKYGTVGTAAKFWSVWKEIGWSEEQEKDLCALASEEPPQDDWEKVMRHRTAAVQEYFTDYGEHRAMEQDRLLFALCRPERLLRFVYQFVIFDAGEKKVARYQQYFCIEEALQRVKQTDPETKGRQGGIVWHTQGSGKSLTMVMLAKALVLDQDILNPRVLLVTDRVDLDDQIYGTFHSCGLEPVQADNGNHLADLLTAQKTSVITTIIDKFDTVSKKRNYTNDDSNIFVLVDESHRSQHGRVKKSLFGERARSMREVLPRACYLGFTGTPIMKADKNTARLFGGLIGKPYTIRDAVEDKAVVPLLYEGRDVALRINRNAIDTWFDRVTENLTEEKKADLKKKFAKAGAIRKADRVIECIAWDIVDHFRKTWKGTGFKGQLVSRDKDTAIRFKEFIEEINDMSPELDRVSCEVLISGPDTRQDHEEVEGEATDRVQKFWEKMVGKHGRFASEKDYNKAIVNSFKKAEEPELIIVVSKLLTGFDAPRNTVLYLTKKLEGHTLLQAIARVNRLHEGKDFGYILDYEGVLGELDEALDLYGSLPDFDQEDIVGAIEDVLDYTKELPQKHSAVWDLFKGVKNKKDREEFELILADEAVRTKFFQRLSEFARVLQIALSSLKYMEITPRNKVDRYRGDLKFFENLRRSARQLYSDEVDYKEYEKRVQALVDRHVGADEVQEIVPLVSIFEEDAFQKEVEKLPNARSKAEAIASRTAKTIREKWEQDPAFFRKFSDMLQQVIAEFRAQRLSDAEYLKKVRDVMKSVMTRSGDDMPEALRHRDHAQAFHGMVRDILKDKNEMTEEQWIDYAVTISIGIEDTIRRLKIVHWTTNDDVINQMKSAMEEFILDEVGEKFDFQPDFDDLDVLMEKCLEIAKVRLP